MRLFVTVMVAWFGLRALIQFAKAGSADPATRKMEFTTYQLTTQGIVSAGLAVWGAIVNGWLA